MNNLYLPVTLSCAAALICLSAQAASPSFDCSKVEAGSIEQMVCQDPALTTLDLKLADTYRAASKKAVNQQPNLLKAEQRGWIKGRNDCWKSDDKNACVADSYRQRTAELQARYQLIAGKGPFFYTCDDNPAKELVATFYPSEPNTALVEFGDNSSLMYLQPDTAGRQYRGGDNILNEGQNITTVVWGYEAPSMKCKARAKPYQP